MKRTPDRLRKREGSGIPRAVGALSAALVAIALCCAVPQGVWHTVVVLEPSVIYEGKDKKYGEDGTETWVNG